VAVPTNQQSANTDGALKPATESMTLLVAAVIVHDLDTQHVVLLKRGPKAKFAQGMWDLPVGKNDPGEPITATAIRELKEETGLTVEASDLRLAHVIHSARGVEAPNGFLTVVFACHHWTGNLTNGEPHKHAQVAWIPIIKIPDEFVPTTATALRSYLAGGPDVSIDSWTSED
jgi:ADP-ribose pyrophosphatase YjhB (NUDIX family)